MNQLSHPLTLPDLFSTAINEYASRTAMAMEGSDTVTYAQFGCRIAELRKSMHGMGIRPGDRVAILAENSPNWTIAYAAIVTMGAIAVPIHTDLQLEEVRNIVLHAGCKLIFISLNQASRIKTEQRCEAGVMVLLDTFEVLTPAFWDKTKQRGVSLLQAGTDGMNTARVSEHDVAVIIYTSGTTGTPKGVMLTHGNLTHNVVMATRMQPVKEDDVFVSILPLSHAYQCTLGFLLPFMSGAEVHYVAKQASMPMLLETFKRVHPTMMLTVPLVMESIFHKQIRPRLTPNKMMDLVSGTDLGKRILYRKAGEKLLEVFGGRLRFFGIGGARLNDQVEEFLVEAGFPYAVGYGMTETAPLLTGCEPAHTRFQSSGRVLEGMQLRVSDPDPESGEGEIQVKGPCVMKGYYNEPELTQKAFTEDGWLRTGDTGIVDDEGYIFLKGRLKNVIIRPNGINVHPEDIEAVLNRHDYINESLVKQKGNQLLAYVHFDLEKIADAEKLHGKNDAMMLRLRVEELLPEIQTWINKRVSRYSRIDRVLIQAQPFPKSASQTIRRHLHQAA
ncbi:AMP-binding protein [bacterium]|nr:AMP-binding protein [bacterium]